MTAALVAFAPRSYHRRTVSDGPCTSDRPAGDPISDPDHERRRGIGIFVLVPERGAREQSHVGPPGGLRSSDTSAGSRSSLLFRIVARASSPTWDRHPASRAAQLLGAHPARALDHGAGARARSLDRP